MPYAAPVTFCVISPVAAFCWTTKEENRSANVLGDPRVSAMLHAGFEREQYGDYILWLSKRTRPGAGS